MLPTQTISALNFESEEYLNHFSRINGIVIEGEQEAHDNFLCLSKLLPQYQGELTRLGKMEFRHRKSFEACGRNLKVKPDLSFASDFFADLRQSFQVAAANQQIATCLLIQALVIECFAIAAYNNYIPVVDNFARKVIESVVVDKYLHLNFGEVWLKANSATVR
jgi:fatty aldehyde decarbonylase